MTCPDCRRTALALQRLRAKHARFAEETNALLTEQMQEISYLREALEAKAG